MPPPDELSAISPQAQAAILLLNNAHAAELSWLEPHALAALLVQAYWSRQVGEADAFLISFDQDAAYESPNFRWFCARYERFAYVDRVVVAAHARGRGLARRLYAALFEQAMRDGHTLVACEVNADPPNPASDAFHEALGFAVAGTAILPDGAKSVRYFTRSLITT